MTQVSDDVIARAAESLDAARAELARIKNVWASTVVDLTGVPEDWWSRAQNIELLSDRIMSQASGVSDALQRTEEILSLVDGVFELVSEASMSVFGSLLTAVDWDAGTGQLPPQPSVGIGVFKAVTAGQVGDDDYAIGDGVVFNSVQNIWIKIPKLNGAGGLNKSQVQRIRINGLIGESLLPI